MTTLGAVRAVISVNDLAKEISRHSTHDNSIEINEDKEIHEDKINLQTSINGKLLTKLAKKASSDTELSDIELFDIELDDTIGVVGREYAIAQSINDTFAKPEKSLFVHFEDISLNTQPSTSLEQSVEILEDKLEDKLEQVVSPDFNNRLQLLMQDFRVLFESYQKQTLRLARSFVTITSSKQDIDLTEMGNITIHKQDIEGYESGLAHLTETLNTMESELESLLRKVEYQELSPQDVELAHLTMLEHLANTSEDRCNSADVQDDVTKGKHLDRVGELCAKIAQMLGCDDDFVDKIACSARLHDIGKIAIPDTILQKPDRLDADEYATMKMHTIHGAEMLSNNNSEIIQMAHRIALSHHENWDGTGYPQQLKQEEIALEGRIAAVADVYDALVSTRSYKEAWPKEKAIEQIKSRRGTKFDPTVVDAFLKVIAD